MQESGWTQETFPLLSSFVMVNNIGVSIKVFAYGISAGLLIGKALLMPNGYSRKHALIHAAKEGAFFIPGVATMLLAAGLIEGFVIPARIPVDFKLIFALGTFFLLVVYFKKKCF